MGALLTMVGSDLRQRARDGSVFVFGLGVPLALMVVFNFLFSGVTGGDVIAPMRLAVAAPADELSTAMTSLLDDLDGVDITLEPMNEAEVRRAVESGDVDGGILVPEGFGTSVMAAGSPQVEVLRGESTSLGIDVVAAVIDGFLGRATAAVRAATAAAALGLPPATIAEVARDVAESPPSLTMTEGVAASEQLSAQGGLVAGQAGLFMMFTVGFGVLAYLEERDGGTLLRLHSLPIRRGSVIRAKTLVSLVLGVVATTVLLVSGGLLFGVSFGSPLPVGVLVVVAVAAATSLVLVVAKLARTAEQAQIMQSILAMVLGLLGGAFFPLAVGGFLGVLLDVSPVASFVRGLGITSAGGTVADLGVPLRNLVGFGAAMTAIALAVPMRSETR